MSKIEFVCLLVGALVLLSEIASNYSDRIH
jgi:hypothetical protein